MFDELSEDIKKVLLAGIGAVAVSAEKTKDVVDELVKKGELTVKQGKVLNEELKQTVKQTIKKDHVSLVNDKLDNFSDEELEALKQKIESIQKGQE